MWLPDGGLLSSPEIDRQSLFIVQGWHELLASTTPDSFRARVLDIFLLLEELERVVELARQDQRWLSHVIAICEEVGEEKTDFGNLLGNSSTAIAAINAIAKFKEGGVGLPILAERVRLASGIAGDTKKLIVEDALRLAGDQHRKHDLLRRLGTIATHVQRQGLAEECIANVGESLLRGKPESVIESICEPLAQAEKMFSCFISVVGEREVLSAIFAGTEFHQIGRKRLEATNASMYWYEKYRESYLIEIKVSALSRRRAAELALGKIHTLLNLLVLYQNKASNNVATNVLVENDHVFIAIEVTPGEHFGLMPRRKSVEIARDRYREIFTRLEGRVSNILESNALGISAEDPRSAIVHLWTALEAIAGSNGANNIGERVAEAVSPIVAWRRIDKIVTYLGISLHKLASDTKTAIDRTHMPASSDTHVARSDLLICLTGPTKNPGILSIFKSCAASPLLCYRIYAAWQTFNDPRNMRAALLLSAKRIRWQVLRLYRARNMLVHRGQRDELIWRLLENAQYYVSTVIGRILHDMFVQPSWSVDTSLEHQRQRFERVCEQLASDGGHTVTIDDLLLHAAGGARALPVWGQGCRYPPQNAAE